MVKANKKKLMNSFNGNSSRKLNAKYTTSFPFFTDREDIEEQVRFKSLYKSSRYLPSISPEKNEINE
jgi:hypothetical protein